MLQRVRSYTDAAWGRQNSTSISEEVALAVTSFEELHNSGKHHSHYSLNSALARVQCNGTGLKETQEITQRERRKLGSRWGQEHMQSYENVTQEITPGEQQELLESEYMCNRVSVGTSEATEET